MTKYAWTRMRQLQRLNLRCCCWRRGKQQRRWRQKKGTGGPPWLQFPANGLHVIASVPWPRRLIITRSSSSPILRPLPPPLPFSQASARCSHCRLCRYFLKMRRKEDFGQTLGHWGVGQGAYLVLPFIGPSTTRDAVGFVTDTLAFDPISYINNVRGRNQVRILQFVDARTELLNASAIMDEASLDPYAFQRDAYFQYRDALLNDRSSGEIDYTDSADTDYNYEAYIEESTDKVITENSEAQKISQAE